MWKSYLLVALRTLRREKTYAAIQVLGLAAGIAVCLIVGLVIRRSLSYDRFHEHADRIYRVVQKELPLLDYGTTRMPPGLARSIEEQVPGVERTAVLFSKRRSLISAPDAHIYSGELFSADEGFFRTFSFRLLRGDTSNVLAEPGEAVLTRTLSVRLFGDQDPMGQTVSIENPSGASAYTVAGIVEDPPGNSHLRFDALLSLSLAERQARTAQTIEWNRFTYFLYVLFEDAISPSSAQAFMNTLGSAASPDLILESLTDIHLYGDPDLNGDFAVKSDVRYLYVLSAIALLTLLISCVSFVNISIAGGSNRAREIGIRKVLGADRAQVIRQHLAESLLTIIASLVFALVITYPAIPYVGRIMGEDLSPALLINASTLLLVPGIVLFVGIAAGSYPAFVLSGLRPAHALHGGQFQFGEGRRSFRQILIGFQFAVTLGLIVCALVMQRQLAFIQEQRLGSADQVLLLNGGEVDDQDAASFERELERRSHVVSVAVGLPPGLDGGGFSSTEIADDEVVWMKHIRGDGDYLSTLGLQLLAGESFSDDGPEDQGYLINETAANIFGLTEADIGSRMQLGTWDDVLIRGIVADFHHRTLHNSIEPMYMTRTTVESSGRGYFLVRLHGESITEGVADVEAVWRQFIPDRPPDYAFLDDRIESLYTAERRLVEVFSAFAGLAIVLACLGLFGLAAYSIVRRMKEMSIRKVMGASARRIYIHLSRDMLAPGAAAAVVAIPVAYAAMHHWLEDFAYHVRISGWTLLLATVLSLVVAWLAISYHAIRVARINPAETLRRD